MGVRGLSRSSRRNFLSFSVMCSPKSSTYPRGGQAKICGRYAENLFRVLFGTHPQFFSRNYVFFPKHFQDPPMFFRKCKFFPLKFGDPPTFLRKIQIYLSFDPLTKDIFLYSEVYSVIFGFLTSFKFFFRYISM